jgi:predicted ATPase
MGRVSIPDTFSTLGPEDCSLGQDENYYETIASLPEHLGAHALSALRDCVQDPSILAAFRTEQGFRDSLLRSVSESSILTTFSEALKGQARLTPFKFAYKFPKSFGDQPPQVATFNVRPASMPPTNVHVIIGRNGVGKTMLLWNLASLLCQAKPPIEYGQLEFLSGNGGESGPERFTNLVTVTFSAFDPFRVPHAGAQFSGDMRYAYVGLRKPPLQRQLTTSEDESFSSVDAPGDEPPHLPPLEAGAKDLRELSSEFQESLARCLSGPRRRRWIDGVRTLETDPGFEELGIPSLLETELDDAVAVSKVSEVFDSLSAGHRIVLLTVTRLVELVDERTLVLLDEPEAHLHPPLLSSFIRVLSALLILRNGAAIVATHSPVVLQEVPKDCVWVLRRSGETVHVERPDIETFGENTGVLTREVFGLVRCANSDRRRPHPRQTARMPRLRLPRIVWRSADSINALASSELSQLPSRTPSFLAPFTRRMPAASSGLSRPVSAAS